MPFYFCTVSVITTPVSNSHLSHLHYFTTHFTSPQVQRTRARRTARQSTSQLPEASQMLRAQRAQAPLSQEHEEEISLQIFQEHQVLPVHAAGLGGGWLAG